MSDEDFEAEQRREAEDHAREVARFRDDKAFTLKYLQDRVREYWQQMDEDVFKPPLPDDVLEVRDVQLGQGPVATIDLVVLARRGDVQDVLEYRSWYDSGSREEPPSGEDDVTWELLSEQGDTLQYHWYYTIHRFNQTPLHEQERRVRKGKWLFEVLRRQGIRCRTHADAMRLDLQVTSPEQADGAIGRYITGLPENANLWGDK